MSNTLLFARGWRMLIPAIFLMFAIAGCNKGNPDAAQSASTTTGAADAASTPASSTASGDGAALYAKANCAMCHGDDRAGKPLGPSLLSLKANWDSAKLAIYLKDPQTYTANDARLSGASGDYSMKMPPANLSPDEIAVLADWLLSQ